MHPLSNTFEIKNQTFTYQEIEAFLLNTTFYYFSRNGVLCFIGSCYSVSMKLNEPNDACICQYLKGPPLGM